MKSATVDSTRGRTKGAQAIGRAIEVARVVARIQWSGANLTRVARETGLNITTTFRILRSLTDHRLLRYNPANQHYTVGPLAFELGLAAREEVQVQTRWRDTVDQIATQTHLTTYLVARSDNEGVCVLCSKGSAPPQAAPAGVGLRAPLGVGSTSLALLASLEDEEISSIISSLSPRLDDSTGSAATPAGILKRVQLTRERGFAIGNTIPGVTGVGVAVLPHQGMTQLAISVAVASGALDPSDAKQIASVVSANIHRRLQMRDRA